MLGGNTYEVFLPGETLKSSSSCVSFGGLDNTGGHDTTNQMRSDILLFEGAVVLSDTVHYPVPVIYLIME